MREVDNINVIKLIQDFQDEDFFYLVMELAPDGDLDKYWRTLK